MLVLTAIVLIKSYINDLQLLNLSRPLWTKALWLNCARQVFYRGMLKSLKVGSASCWLTQQHQYQTKVRWGSNRRRSSFLLQSGNLCLISHVSYGNYWAETGRKTEWFIHSYLPSQAAILLHCKVKLFMLCKNKAYLPLRVIVLIGTQSCWRL